MLILNYFGTHLGLLFVFRRCFILMGLGLGLEYVKYNSAKQ